MLSATLEVQLCSDMLVSESKASFSRHQDFNCTKVFFFPRYKTPASYQCAAFFNFLFCYKTNSLTLFIHTPHHLHPLTYSLPQSSSSQRHSEAGELDRACYYNASVDGESREVFCLELSDGEV